MIGINRTGAGRTQRHIQRESPEQGVVSCMINSRNLIEEKKEEGLDSYFNQTSEKVPTLVVDRYTLVLFDDVELARNSVVNVTNPSTSGTDSVNDPRMGTSQDDKRCFTCSKTLKDCPGHYGRIVLNTMIYHPMFIEVIVKVLTCVCNSCGELLLPENDIRNNPNIMKCRGKKRLEEIEKESKNLSCSNSKSRAPNVTPCQPNRRYLPQQIKVSKEIKYQVQDRGSSGPIGTMDIEKVAAILDSIPNEHAELMGFANGAHPRRLILRSMPVVPPCARPQVPHNGIYEENDMTKMYINIVKVNNELASRNISESEKRDKTKRLFELFEQLVSTSDDKNSSFSGNQRSIKTRITGKDGIINDMIQGKRCNWTARTVLSPNPSLRFGQISIPKIFGSYLTVPVYVQAHNRRYLQRLIKENKVNWVTPGSGPNKGATILITDKNRNLIKLNIGDKVNRHQQNGDYVLFNRQPSLHKYSMMGEEVIQTDDKSIGMPLPVAAPHNADFDGDEGNIHATQLPEAILETRDVASAVNCMMSGSQNKPTVGAVLDSVTGAFIMTSKFEHRIPLFNPDGSPQYNPDGSIKYQIEMRDTTIEESDFFACLDMVIATDGKETLFKRLENHGYTAIERNGLMYWSGKALFSSFLPADFFYQKGSGKDTVRIVNGVLLTGAITKDHIGSAHRSIIQVIHAEYGNERAVEFLTDVTRVTEFFLTFRGFSVGLGDCIIGGSAGKEVSDKMFESIALAKAFAEAQGTKIGDSIEDELREQRIRNELNGARDTVGKLAKEKIPMSNSLLLMSKSGAKGTELNLTQITTFLGQMLVQSKRIDPTLSQGTRCLPYFADDSDPASRGFCTRSFQSGLSPAEAFFAAMAGREGLVDTAVGTAETGSQHKKMAKIFEDVKVNHDGSVCDAYGNIIQFSYGYDGFSASQLMNTEIIPYSKAKIPSFIDFSVVFGRLNAKYGYQK